MTGGEVRHLRSPFGDRAYAAAAGAYAAATPDGWEHGVHAAIRGLFDFLTAEAPRTDACIVDHCGAGPQALARRDAAIGRFTELLRPGFEAAPTPPPPIIAEAICGGIYELVRSHVLEDRLEQLPAAAPDATIVALAPFMGTSAAIDLANSTKVQTGR
jgi:hypothetical protein